MLTWNSERLDQVTLPLGTSWLLAACMEARGKQELWTRQRPEALVALREQALIQSVESSNRLEGVVAEAGRLRPVVLGGAKPRDRAEEELAGYRRALDWVLGGRAPAAVDTNVILRLHATAQGGTAGDAGEWKERNNEIIEILPSGERRVRFTPPPARETPELVRRLCRSYEIKREARAAPPLLLAGAFVFDFLCIHPFRDGNGRVSRLLTALLLRQEGFEVVRYVSLERIVEETKEDYYRVLEECSVGWHEGVNEIVPWWNYFLGMVRAGYREWESRMEIAEAGQAKGELIRRSVLQQAGRFTLGGLAAQLPGVSVQWIKKVLADLKREGRVQLEGRGRGAAWRVVR